MATKTTKTATGWKTLTTDDAARSGREVRKHLDCEIVDSQSINFSCYTCEVTVVWIG